MRKIIVAGGRNFNDYDLVVKTLDDLYKGEDIMIVSGAAAGADTLGVVYAIRHNLSYIKMPADWEKYGKSAGYKRNEQMAIFADEVVAFWNGESKGTKHMIDIATSRNMPTYVIRYEGN